MLGLGPEAGAPIGPAGSPPKFGTEGGPVRLKAKRVPRKPVHQRTRKPRRLPEPSGDPRGHIQRWLVPGVAAGHTGQEICPTSVDGPARHALVRPDPRTDCSTEPWPGQGTIPGVPGSSTDPPRGVPSADPWALTPETRALAAVTSGLPGVAEGEEPRSAYRAGPTWAGSQVTGRAPSRMGASSAMMKTFLLY